MTKPDRSTPLTISLQIPTYWTPEQAFAVFELIDELRDTIWRCYALQLQEETGCVLADREHSRVIEPDQLQGLNRPATASRESRGR